jgi:hypothetical protein
VGDPAGSNATAGLALRVTGTHKPLHHDKVKIPSGGGLTISVQKSKSMAFKGRDPVRTKTVIDNRFMEQVNLFNYLGSISYEKELDIDNKLHNYFKITGILNNVFRLQIS